MKSSFLVATVVAFGFFAYAAAIPIGCQKAGTKVIENAGAKDGSTSEDAEAAVLNRLARKIDELRKLKVATLKSEGKKADLSISATSVKKEMGADIVSPEDEKTAGGDLADVIAGEKEKDHEQEQENKKATQNSVSLRPVVRVSAPGSTGSGFLTAEEQKDLAEYVRVKMLKGSHDLVRMPMDPVIRQHIPSTLSKLATVSDLLSDSERKSLSRLVRNNGIKFDGAVEDDIKIGAFVRAALGGDEDISLGVKAATSPSGGLSHQEAEKMSLQI